MIPLASLLRINFNPIKTVKFSFPITTLCLALISSCATYNKSPVATYQENDSEDGSMDQLTNTDQKTKAIKIINSSKKLLNGNLVAKVEIQNSSVHPIRFNYKFDWLDETGSLDSTSSFWRKSSINGNQIISISDIDTRGSATEFRVLFKGI
jgi:uncharacterized protein YcfL